ncbi:MAG: hypothetical protein AMXMBFR53_14590 [Gemmatimonadota bacterium]
MPAAPSGNPTFTRVAVLTALSVVAMGALAMAGWVHPMASSEAMAAYLPRITLPTVVGAAALDGVNPCAFTVLLLLATALIAAADQGPGGVGSLRARLLTRGGIFIAAVFLTYLALGLGVLGTLGLFTRRHWPARIAALLAVFAGLWMLKDYFLADSRWRLRAPARTAAMARKAAIKGTGPALFAGGVLIGLCTVPCSGAVYLAVISLLAAGGNRATGYGYLVLYNVVFVLPLLGMLALAAHRSTLRRLAEWNRTGSGRARLVLGGGVVLGGLAILATL